MIHAVSETLRNMNINLGSLVTRSNKQLRHLQSVMEDLASLNDSQRGLIDTVDSLHSQLNEHKEQTAENLLRNESSSG